MLRTFCTMLGLFLIGFSAQLWAQETSLGIELANQMDKATSLGQVLSVLPKIYQDSISVTERLMIYSRIPSKILDVAETVEKVDAAQKVPMDRPYAVEFVYLMALDAKINASLLSRALRFRSKPMINERIVKVLVSWNVMALGDMDPNMKRSDELQKAGSHLVVSLWQRANDFIGILMKELPEESRRSLLKIEKKFNKVIKQEAKQERKAAIKKVDIMDRGVEQAIGASIGLGVGGGLFTAGMAEVITQEIMSGAPGFFIAAGIIGIIFGTKRYEEWMTKRLAISIKTSENISKKFEFLMPFFEIIKTEYSAASCAQAAVGK